MRISIIAITLALCAGFAPAQAQDYPTRTVTLIVPFPPGGSTDVAGRILADKMGAALGQAVIVENVGGAGGLEHAVMSGKGRLAPRDRLTATPSTSASGTPASAASSTTSITICRPNFKAPIGLVSINPMLLVATKEICRRTISNRWSESGWKAPIRATPITSIRTPRRQVGGLLLEKLTDTKVLFVPYRWRRPGDDGSMSGPEVGLLSYVQNADALPRVRHSTVKALAELSPHRSASMPDNPSSAGLGGVASLDISRWFGLYAPKSTPRSIIAEA